MRAQLAHLAAAGGCQALFVTRHSCGGAGASSKKREVRAIGEWDQEKGSRKFPFSEKGLGWTDGLTD